ncbi:PEP-CTERM sorting domain-containing protein [bacterium]|nr:PEP-CTERM sorting domain-containing protein [bacterium]
MTKSLLERFDVQIAIFSAMGITATMAAPQQEAEAADYVYYQPNGGAGWVVPADAGNIGLYINVETGVAGTSDGDVPGWDLNPYGDVMLNWFRNDTSGAFYMYYPGVTTGFDVGNLAVGTTVGSSADFITSSNTSNTFFGPNPGEWLLNSPNYVGFSFVAADTAVHYGWLRIDVGAAVTVRTIMEVGYSAIPGQSVQVGVVPEPSTVIMGLLASGATGVIAWRRRIHSA